jgi:hypothetical protein
MRVHVALVKLGAHVPLLLRTQQLLGALGVQHHRQRGVHLCVAPQLHTLLLQLQDGLRDLRAWQQERLASGDVRSRPPG